MKKKKNFNGQIIAEDLYKKPTLPRYKLIDSLNGRLIIESDDPQDIIKHINHQRPQSVFDRKEGYFCSPDVAFKKA